MANNVSVYISNLQDKPSYPKYELQHWTDYLELLCLANLDGEVSKADYIKRFSQRESDLHQGDVEDIEAMELLDKEDSFQSTNRSLKADKWQIRLDDWFLVIEHRVKLYGEYYPFELINDSLFLKDSFTKHNLLYTYLLFCSNLYLFDESDRGLLANSFELLSLDVLKNILPKNANIHLFGKNTFNTGDFKGPLWNKIHLLADRLNEKVNELLKKDNYPPQNTGDDGLDVVGWVSSGDELPSKLVYFGQCTCNVNEWKSKQNDSSFNAWSNKIHLTNYTNNIIIIPFCYRDSTGLWISVGDIHKSFLIDRKRLIYNLYDDFSVFESLPCYKLIESMVIAKEEVF
jgi:hypothetical protein